MRDALTAGAMLAAVALCACQKTDTASGPGPAEKAGQQIDKAASRAGDELNKLADKAGEGMKNAGEKMQQKAREAEADNARKDAQK
ncbi:hypothetical protein [Noviherbaspirillum humi]|uniref:hypothetical protein n=1 Tax=Noviherbaspirillum humi TaxID=1688639 RepID=UPI001160CC81|nr:hypothetical protein [Noviherbaspirillum humi]